MKTIFSLILTLIFICVLNIPKVAGQSVAFGHVSAEVLEEVSAVSKANTAFNLKNNNVNANLAVSGQLSLDPGSLDLGSLTINAGKSIACQVMVQPAKLSDSKGHGFVIEPSIKTNSPEELPLTEGAQTLQINGRARLLKSQATGLYKGTYTIVLAFN